MLNLFDRLIYLLVYFGIIIGIWLLIYPIINPYVNKRRMLRRFRRNNARLETTTKKSKIISHLQILMSVTINTKSTYAITSFVLLTIVLFAIALIFLYKTLGEPYSSLVGAVTISTIPYLLLKIRLHNIRVNSSYEAYGLVTELINQYKINYLNMLEAIDQTIPRLKKHPYSQKALFRLSLQIKQYQRDEELDEIIQEFNYALNTGWAMLLANNLSLSIHYGDDVRESLEDILGDLSDLKKIVEKNKQYNNETFMMIKYISPGTYLFSVYTMFTVFGFNLEKFIDYQFINPLGLKFFLLTTSAILLNFIIYFFVRRPKNDF